VSRRKQGGGTAKPSFWPRLNQCIATPAPGDPCRSWSFRWQKLGNKPSTSDWMGVEAALGSVIGFGAGDSTRPARQRIRRRPSQLVKGQPASSLQAQDTTPVGRLHTGMRHSGTLIVVQGRGRTCTGTARCGKRETWKQPPNMQVSTSAVGGSQAMPNPKQDRQTDRPRWDGGELG
jgi:hypothetical protein